jgi:hypothetical protein
MENVRGYVIIGTVRYSLKLNYPATVTQVGRMLADPEFAAFAAQQTTPDGKVEIVDIIGSAEAGFTATVRRKVPSSQIPSQFRALAGAELEVRQAEVWEPEANGQRHGTVALEILGTPLIMTGTVKLIPMPDGGTAQVYEGEIAANIPFFGSAIEKAAEQPVRVALALTQKAGQDWLSSHQS